MLKTFDKYGTKITSESYANESSFIESMLEDFSEQDEDISALQGIAELLKNLRNAEDNFKQANLDWTKAGTQKRESASAIKKEMIPFINEKLIPYLNAMLLVRADYKDFILHIEAEIEKANDTV